MRPTSARSSSTTRPTTSPARPRSTSTAGSLTHDQADVGQLQLGRLRERRHRGLRPGREHDLRADGRCRARACSARRATPAPSTACPPTAPASSMSTTRRAQPWVTSVGGTSLENYNPGTNPHPAYPAGVETVWNPGDLCNTSANEGGEPGLFWCDTPAPAAAASSEFWGRPSYQRGPGMNNRFTTYGNGTTHCRWPPRARRAARCRTSRPTPTSSPRTRSSAPATRARRRASARRSATASPCRAGSGSAAPACRRRCGPAIIADRDSFHRPPQRQRSTRSCTRCSTRGPGRYFHDITGRQAGPHQQRPVPDHARLRRGHRDRLAEDGARSSPAASSSPSRQRRQQRAAAAVCRACRGFLTNLCNAWA